MTAQHRTAHGKVRDAYLCCTKLHIRGPWEHTEKEHDFPDDRSTASGEPGIGIAWVRSRALQPNPANTSIHMVNVAAQAFMRCGCVDAATF